ncbi:MAG: site-2 protease family protein, partial [Planctomycetes bacterium]|nr:site-2 protease family protein [Planctomycetota bacterium]
MSERKNAAGNLFKALFFVLLAAVLIRFVADSPARSFRILIAIVGFGTCIIVHEFGHFIVAKLSGIKCHTFSIGFPPTFLGIKRTERGVRFRLLPGIFSKSVEGQEEKEARLSVTLYKPGKEADTEYCLGLIPFGGFVGMLGQEDAGVEEVSEDPASFANKPISTRMRVIAAGVIFNLIAAIVIFTTIFMVGIEQTPAVVGAVVEGMPAAEAGLVAGDEIMEINGKKKPDFSNLLEAAALSGKDEKVSMTVRHTNGLEEDFEIAAKLGAGMKLRQFGIQSAMTLKIAQVDEPEALEEEIGLRPGDEIVAIDKTEVGAAWEFEDVVANTLKPYVTLTAKRFDAESGETKEIETELPLELVYVDSAALESEKDLAHIHSIVPRLKVNAVTAGPLPLGGRDALLEKIGPLLEKIGLSKFVPVRDVLDPALEAGDIIVKIGDVANPTFYELREVTAEYADVAMAMTVLRLGDDGKRKAVDVEVVPRTPSGQDRPLIGIAVSL